MSPAKAEDVLVVHLGDADDSARVRDETVGALRARLAALSLDDDHGASNDGSLAFDPVVKEEAPGVHLAPGTVGAVLARVDGKVNVERVVLRVARRGRDGPHVRLLPRVTAAWVFALEQRRLLSLKELCVDRVVSRESLEEYRLFRRRRHQEHVDVAGCAHLARRMTEKCAQKN